MEELYKEYGKLMVQLEILNGRILKVKKAIQAEMNNQNKPEKKKD